VKRGWFGGNKELVMVWASTEAFFQGTKDLSQVFDFFFAFSRVLIVVECSFKFWCNHAIANNIISSFAVCFDKFFDYLIFAIYLNPLF